MGVESGVAPSHGHQLFVGALFGQLALVHQHDAIGMTHGAQAVGDEKHGFALQGLLQIQAHR